MRLIRVKVFPGSKKNEIVQKSKNNFEIKVKTKPWKGRANQSVIEVLANYLDISEENIRLIKGFRQRNKIFEILD